MMMMILNRHLDDLRRNGNGPERGDRRGRDRAGLREWHKRLRPERGAQRQSRGAAAGQDLAATRVEPLQLRRHHENLLEHQVCIVLIKATVTRASLIK